MSYPQSDRFISSNFSASSASPPLGAGAIAASPPPGSVLAGSSRPRRIAWCPGPRLFAGDDEHSVRDNDRDDHDAAQIASDVSDAGSASDTGDAEAEVVSKAAAGANARKCAGFFIVGHPELKFYEYLGSHHQSHSSARLLAIHSDYALLTKSFAWSPSPAMPDLLAIAQGTGKVVLVRLGMFTWLSSGPVGLGGWTGSGGADQIQASIPIAPTSTAQSAAAASSSQPQQSTFSSLTSFLRSSLSSSPPTAPGPPPTLHSGPVSKVLAEFSPKHPRSCNAVAFSPDGRYLAAGYEKVRNDAGVYIWDLEAGKAASSGQMHLQSGIARSLAGGAHPHPSPSLHPHTPFGSAVPLPLGPADPVVSLAFLSPHLIVAGVPGKGIRGWDLRNPHSGGSPNFAIATKAVYGLAADPWSNHRVAGFGDDGVVRIFDLRRGAVAPGAPYPTAASSEPLLALPTSDIFPKGVSQLSWSLARSGMLAASGLGASAVRVWDVREAGGAASAPDGAGQPVVWRTKTIRTRNGVPITGMCFVPPLADPPGGMVAEPTPEQIDGSATGHRLIASLADDSIAILDVREAQRNAWGARGGNSMAWVGGRGIVCITEGVRTDAQAGVMTMGPGTTVPEADIPSMLGGDVAVVMRERAAAGYGVEPSSNLSLFERDPSSFGMDASHLADLWTFLLASKELNDSEGARTSDGRDWSFAGVAAVLERGYRIAGGKIDSNGASLAAIPITEQTKSAPILGKSITAQRLSSAPAFGALLEQNLQEGMDEFAAELALPDGSDGSATSDAGPVSRAGPIPDEYKKLALAMCGWWHLPGADGSTTTPPPYHMPSDDELEDALHEMELRGQFEKAAGWALFRGASFGRAIKSLRSSNEERLKLVAAALSAALPAPSSSSPGGHAGVLVLSGNQLPPLFVDLCSSLATDLHDPYLRAMFALVASSGNWHVVLDEKELPLRDRVGVAIRFLPDEQLLAYVRRTRAVMVQSGSVEGLLLTGICTPDGLARDGVQLLQTYVDRTADVQTASLATAMVIPGRFADRVVREWVDAYRSLLDRWEMFHERARFDIARGRYAGSATLRAAGGMGTPVLGPVGLNRENRGLDIPPQIAVRCNFCSASIQHKQNGSRRDFKAIACPNCRKPLPRCALCLLPMGTWPVNLDTVSGGLGGPFSDRGALTSAASSPANSPPKKDGPAPSQQMIAGLAGGVASAAKTSLLAGVGLKSQNSEVREKVGNPSALTGFDAWFTWCVVCRHGGHNAHVREWFAEYNICPVSGCGCKCGSL